MTKVIHKRYEFEGFMTARPRTVCGRVALKLNLAGSNSVATCSRCLSKMYPGYSFKYELNKEDRRYRYTIKYGNELVGSVVLVPSSSGFSAFILDLKVEPGYRKVGWGSFLIKQLQTINGPPIQLKCEPFGQDENRITQKDLKSFYEMLGFVELQGTNHQMIWYPNSNIGDSHVVCVRIKPRSFKAYVQDYPEMYGEGSNYCEAVGDLVSKHKSFFKISLVDVWS